MAERIYAVVDLESWHKHYTRKQLAQQDIRVLVADNLATKAVLSNIPEQSAFLAILELPLLRGLRAYEFIVAKVRELRELCPTLGIVFLKEGHESIRRAALPHLVWVVREQALDLTGCLEAIRYYKTEQCAQYRDTSVPEFENLSSVRIKPEIRTRTHAGITPNFNIKHPSMLIPLARASVQSGQEIYCEISAQEALIFYDVGYARQTRTMVGEALAAVRKQVNQVNKDYGSCLRLHLDHCDDLELIRHSAGIGFDSIMADGSAMSISQNVLFTRTAQNIVAPYGIPLEGEIGNIDGEGLRRWNKTRINDFKYFVEETGVNYVGVHAGQFHSFSYDYKESRLRYAELVACAENTSGDGWSAFLDACGRLDKKLAAQGFHRASAERMFISEWGSAAFGSSEQSCPSVAHFLSGLQRTLSFRQQRLLDVLEREWLTIRLEKANTKLSHWEIILGAASSPPDIASKARIDFDLLNQLSENLNGLGTRIVIHGGSSISQPDLRLLSRYRKVARINFGSTVFDDYIDCLLTNVPGHSAYSPEFSHELKLSLIRDAAHDAETWLTHMPEHIDAFAAYIMERYVSELMCLAQMEARPQQSTCHAS